MSWFQPMTSPPNAASLYPTRGSRVNNHREHEHPTEYLTVHDVEEELEFDPDHYLSQRNSSSIRNQNSVGVDVDVDISSDSFSKRIERLISPMASTSALLLRQRFASSTTHTKIQKDPKVVPHPSFPFRHAFSSSTSSSLPQQVRNQTHTNRSHMNNHRDSSVLDDCVSFFDPRPISIRDPPTGQTQLFTSRTHPTTHAVENCRHPIHSVQSHREPMNHPSVPGVPHNLSDPSNHSFHHDSNNNTLPNRRHGTPTRFTHDCDSPKRWTVRVPPSSHTTNTQISQQGFDFSWNQVGQSILSYKESSSFTPVFVFPGHEPRDTQHDHKNDNNNDPSQSREKKKQKTKKRPLPDIRAMFSPNEQGPSRENQGDRNLPRTCKMNSSVEKKKETKKKKQQQQQQQQQQQPSKQSSSNLILDQDQDHQDHWIVHGQKRTMESKTTTTTTTTTKSMADDETIQRSHSQMTRDFSSTTRCITCKTFYILEESYHLRNAAANLDCLHQFLHMVNQQRFVSWTMVFYDKDCTTPFLPLTQRYCTDKGPPCTMWNCTCDHQSRARQAAAPVAGVLFSLSSPSLDNQKDAGVWKDFFLPLGPSAEMDDDGNLLQGPTNIDAGYERMIHWPLLPIQCETTLKQRWDALRTIFMNKHLTCVTYNAICGLMPYHYHCLNDIQRDIGSSSHVEGHLDLIIPKVWDLRVASWLLSPNADEEELEFDHKCSGFSQFIDSVLPPVPMDASDHLKGFVSAIKNLHFLNNIYPRVNQFLTMNGLLSAFDQFESPLLSILSAMECHGVGFLKETFKEIQEQIEKRIDELTYEARLLAKDDTFLLSSPRQVSHLLFDVMKIALPEGLPKKPTTSQHRSTSEETLQAIQSEAKIKHGVGHKIIDILLEFRTLNKMLTTYIRPYPSLCCYLMARPASRDGLRRSKKMNQSNTIGRIHPMWIQTAVRTGRLSCRKPNMQQIPTGSVFGTYPRSAFVPTSKNRCLFSFDYSQNEVRILAHMSSDEELTSLFHSPDDIDIYKQMSSAITGKAVDLVSDHERAISKQCTLAILYGMGVNQVARKLGVDHSSANSFLGSFFGRFQGVKRWIEQTKRFALQHKYVTTISGRKRYLDDIDSDDNDKKAQAERQAVNTIVQGSAADIMKLAMLKIAARITDWNMELSNDGGVTAEPRILLQIHDELIFEVSETHVERLKTIVVRCAGECSEELCLRVPLKLKCRIGSSWASLTEY